MENTNHAVVLDKFLKARTEYLKLIKSAGMEVVTQWWTSYFGRHPDVVAVDWMQFTPSFNDGDPCTWRTYVKEVWVVTGDTNTTEPDDEDNEGPPNTAAADGSHKGYGDAENFMEFEDLLQAVFEDANIRVSRTEDGGVKFRVDPYEDY